MHATPDPSPPRHHPVSTATHTTTSVSTTYATADASPPRNAPVSTPTSANNLPALIRSINLSAHSAAHGSTTITFPAVSCRYTPPNPHIRYAAPARNFSSH